MTMILEVIVQTLDDARAAAEGGADRLEIVREIDRDGLTPPVDLVRRIMADVPLPVRVMVRENAGFMTTPAELETMRRAAAQFADLGVDGLVVGFHDAGEPRLDLVAAILDAAPATRATFHRAFDFLRDPLGALDAIARMPAIDSVLTSGGNGDPADRCDRLLEIAARTAGRLRIIAGGGVGEPMLRELARSQCVREVHVGRLAREGAERGGPVSAARVRRIRVMLDRDDTDRRRVRL
jgi:copper homeostasis protein